MARRYASMGGGRYGQAPVFPNFGLTNPYERTINTGRQSGSNSGYIPVARRQRGAHVTAPTFAAPNLEALNALRARAGTLQSTINDPLASPGVAGTITSLNSQLARQAQAARGQAMGRATNTGQAGFAGTMAQSGATIEGALGDARYQGQSDLVADVLKNTNAELAGNLEARGGLETSLNAQQLDRARILAEIAAQNAQIDRDYYSADRQADIEDARGRREWEQMQQQRREYDLSRGDRNREFDLTRGDQNWQFGLERQDRNRAYDDQREERGNAQEQAMAAARRQFQMDVERRNAESRQRSQYQQQNYGELEDLYGRMGIPRRRPLFYPGSHFNTGDPRFNRTQ